MSNSITEDALLDSRLKFSQPKSGYRAAIDPILLAASMAPGKNNSVLDVGMGAGAAALCLAERVKDIPITGVEVQLELSELARRNIETNGFSERINVIHTDILEPHSRLFIGSFDHVMTNPPFVQQSHGRGSFDAGKKIANQESSVPLSNWIDFCLKMLRPKGTLTIIHRADRLDAILAALYSRAGAVIIFPLWPNLKNKPAKRILVRCKKGARAPLVLSPGLTLHEADGSYTSAANQILKNAEGLDILGNG